MPIIFLIPVIAAAKLAAVHVGAALAHSAMVQAAVHTTAVAVHSGAAAAGHQAVVISAAHTQTTHLLRLAAHFAVQTVLPAAIAAGTVVGATMIIGSDALKGIVFLGAVAKYRALHHLDENGQRKMEFRQIEPCAEDGCECADFTLADPAYGKRMCVCGHAWHKHPMGDLENMRREGKDFVKAVGEAAFTGALKDHGLN